MKASTRWSLFWVVAFALLAGATSFAQFRREDPGITVYVDTNYRGQSATFNEDVPYLGAAGFNDRISSVRVPQGEEWELCKHANYRGDCVTVSGDVPNLGERGLQDEVSSLRRVRGGYRDRDRDRWEDSFLILYEDTNFRGRSTDYSSAAPQIDGRVQSATIGRGQWELCEGRNYSGRCVTLERSAPDLQQYNLSNRVGSARPVGGLARGDRGRDRDDRSPWRDWSIVLHEDRNYRGRSTTYRTTEPNVNVRVRSVTIERGEWELCEGRNFSGRCVTLTSSSPNLRSQMRDRIGSLRPIRGERRRN